MLNNATWGNLKFNAHSMHTKQINGRLLISRETTGLGTHGTLKAAPKTKGTRSWHTNKLKVTKLPSRYKSNSVHCQWKYNANHNMSHIYNFEISSDHLTRIR